MDIKQYVESKASLAKESSRTLSFIETNVKNKALLCMADALIKHEADILSANSKDIENGKNKGLSTALLDRLLLNKDRILSMAEGLKQVASLPDPIGEVVNMWQRPNGLKIGRTRVPLGVIGIIYEARPNVTVDAAALCIKSGNAVILKGGSEAIHSNMAIAKIIGDAAVYAGLPNGCIQLLETTDREAVSHLMKLNNYLDVIIPRGGAGLINFVVNNSNVPVIQTGVGNCHVYVDDSANLDMAVDIIINAKTQRPAVCNAIETILLHKDIAKELLLLLREKLSKLNLNVELRGCSTTQELIDGIVPATYSDYANEFLDYILAVKVVNSLNEAMEHIHEFGTKHSEAIITSNYFNSQKFLREVDAAAVYVNASTRFTDGFEFGFGGEIGISTQKLHARGPMGLNELTTIKHIIYGEGQIR